MFADKVTAEAAKAAFSAEHPPAYVRSVDYGCILMVKMETSAVDTTVNLKGAFEQATAGLTAGGDLKSRYESIIRNATFTVVALGGGPGTSVQVFEGAAGGELSGLKEYIQKDAVYRRDNPGLPIAYQVAFLKDNRFATMGFTTDYTETQAVRYLNGFVRSRHDGAYVAKFQVAWTYAGADGEFTEQRVWNSGDTTAGYSGQVDLPGAPGTSGSRPGRVPASPGTGGARSSTSLSRARTTRAIASKARR